MLPDKYAEPVARLSLWGLNCAPLLLQIAIDFSVFTRTARSGFPIRLSGTGEEIERSSVAGRSGCKNPTLPCIRHDRVGLSGGYAKRSRIDTTVIEVSKPDIMDSWPDLRRSCQRLRGFRRRCLSSTATPVRSCRSRGRQIQEGRSWHHCEAAMKPADPSKEQT
jgi:hypothetical protein